MIFETAATWVEVIRGKDRFLSSWRDVGGLLLVIPLGVIEEEKDGEEEEEAEKIMADKEEEGDDDEDVDEDDV